MSKDKAIMCWPLYTLCPSELSSTTSSLNEANEGQGQTTRTDDLDIAHIEELRDLEVRLTEKHSQDLCDLENRYKVRIQEIQDHHQVMTPPPQTSPLMQSKVGL